MFSLKEFNTFSLDVKAKQGIIIDDVKKLAEIEDDNLVILGSGSDVLFTDDFDGTVLVNNLKSLDIKKDSFKAHVKVGSGFILDNLISTLLDNNIYGLENLSAVPGTVGASPIQNVGAYGVEIGSFIESLKVYDLDYKLIFDMTHDELNFSYRHSYFKENKDRKLFITEVNLKLDTIFKPRLNYNGLIGSQITSAYELRNKIVSLRNLKLPDPKVVGNAGSFFKNPKISREKLELMLKDIPDMPYFKESEDIYKIPAGFLIDKAGCRGITHGNAGTWEMQALVIVNRGNAKPLEIVALGKYICTQVKAFFDIDLEPEVRIYGKQGELSWQDL